MADKAYPWFDGVTPSVATTLPSSGGKFHIPKGAFNQIMKNFVDVTWNVDHHGFNVNNVGFMSFTGGGGVLGTLPCIGPPAGSSASFTDGVNSTLQIRHSALSGVANPVTFRTFGSGNFVFTTSPDGTAENDLFRILSAGGIEIPGGPLVVPQILNHGIAPATPSGSATTQFQARVIDGGNGIHLNLDSVRVNVGTGHVNHEFRLRRVVDLTEMGGVCFDSANIRFTWSGLEKMRMTSNGRLGIGTTTPATKLQINDSDSAASGAVGSQILTSGNQAMAFGVNSNGGTAAGSHSWIQSTYFGVGQTPLYLNPNGAFVYVGSQFAFIALPPDYASDAAAAAGGLVPVGGVYRTGNTMKIRVS